MTSKRFKPNTMSYGISVAGLAAFSVLALPIITTIIPKEILIWTHMQNPKSTSSPNRKLQPFGP